MASIVTKLLGIYIKNVGNCTWMSSCPWKSGTARNTSPSPELLNRQWLSPLELRRQPERNLLPGIPRDGGMVGKTEETARDRGCSAFTVLLGCCREQTPETLIWRQEPNNGNPVLLRVQNNPSKPDTEPLLSTVLEPKPLLAPKGWRHHETQPYS